MPACKLHGYVSILNSIGISIISISIISVSNGTNNCFLIQLQGHAGLSLADVERGMFERYLSLVSF